MDNDILEVNEFGVDELLELYDLIVNHLKYLESSIIEVAEGGDSGNE